MIRDITIGQYYQTDSIIHRLDPRTKLFATFVYVLTVCLTDNRYMLVIAFLSFVACLTVSKISFSYMLRGLRPLFFFLLISMLLNLFFTKGDPFIDWSIIHISWQGFRTAIYTTTRVILLVLGASVITYTTTPTKLTDGLEQAFHKWKVFHIPVHEISMMIGIALRFLPILVEETDKLKKAQQARGAEFEQGGVLRRIKSILPVILPMFLLAIRRANDLSDAMEARCYQGDHGRTKLYPLRYRKADALVYGLTIVYGSLMIALRIIYSQGLLDQILKMQMYT